VASQQEINEAKTRIAAGNPTQRDQEVARQTLQQTGKDRNEMQEAIREGEKKSKQARSWF
jgi:hypothetical protein